MLTILKRKKQSHHTIYTFISTNMRLLCILFSIVFHTPSEASATNPLKGIYRLFLESNEIECPTEARLTLNSGTAIIAVSSMMILDLITRTTQDTLEQLYIIDKSQATEHLWLYLCNQLTQEDEFDSLPSSLEYSFFKKDLFKHLQDNASIYWPDNDTLSREAKITKLKEKIKKGHSWLSTEETFRFIKNKFVDNEVHFIRGDLSNLDDIQTLVSLIEEHRETIKFIYLSNIHEYIKEEKKEKDYVTCLEELASTPFITDKTKVLATKLRYSRHERKCLLPITSADRISQPLQREIFDTISHYLCETIL